MNKSDIRIFIVEDDPSMGKALHELVKKMGFQAVLCTNPTDAQAQFRIQGAQLAIIDCMLPKMSGVDLAQKLKTEAVATDLPIILTSGIFRDKSFAKDALHKTGAIAFVYKPFNLEELTQQITAAVEKHIDEASPLESLLSDNPSPVERVQLINAWGQIEAFDIPWLCCLLMNPSVTGMLTFQNEKSKAAIYFSSGNIVQVDMQNPESFFGALLVENGFLTPEQLESALKTKSPKKLGERLVDLNLLSPHVINLTNAEQTAIRLSRIITDTIYTVRFEEKAVEKNSASIDTEGIASFLVDWINSKIEVSWLKQRYLKWLNSPAVKVQTQTPTFLRLWSLPPLKQVPKLVGEIENGTSLSQLLAKGDFPEELVYQVFHLLVIIGHIHLKREVRAVDEAAQLARLEKIWGDMRTQDYFAVLGVAKNARAPDIKKTYYELAKIFHPDKIPGNASQQLKDLAQKVFGQMTTAYEVLSNEQKRAAYIKEVEMGRAEKILQAESLLEEGKASLKSGQAKKAMEKFEQAMRLKPPTSELLIHLTWARLMGGGDDEKSLMQIEQTLNKIPPEDRHNSIYYFVKGLFQHMIGEDVAAKKNIQHALALNPKFLEAERALRTFDNKKSGGKTDIFRGDLKDVVGSLFRKK